MSDKELADLYDSYEKIYEAPFEITGPHSYRTGDGRPEQDSTIRNSPKVVGAYQGDDKTTRKRARNKADKLNQEYGASVYRVNRVDEPRKRGTPVEDSVEYVLDYLIDEGFTDSYDSAIVFLESMSDEWFEEILSEATFHGKMPGRAIQTRATPSGNYTPGRDEPDQRDSAMKSTLGQMRANWPSHYENEEMHKREKEAYERKKKAERFQVRSGGIRADEGELRKPQRVGRQRRYHQRTPAFIARQKAQALRKNTDPNADLRRKRILKALKNKEKWGQRRLQKEQLKYILDYLLTEGFTDSYDSALVILETMSEEWLMDLIEKFNPEDYKEYHQKDHTEYNSADQWDRENEDYQRERVQRDRQKNTGRRKRAIAATIKERQRRARR